MFGDCSARVLNLTVINNGTQDLTSLTISNSTSLNYGSYYMNFTYDVPTNIPTGESRPMNITVDINTSITNNTAGIYRGWIYLNATESSPYQSFNLSLHVNLTNQLIITISEVTSGINSVWSDPNKNSENIKSR